MYFYANYKNKSKIKIFKYVVFCMHILNINTMPPNFWNESLHVPSISLIHHALYSGIFLHISPAAHRILSTNFNKIILFILNFINAKFACFFRLLSFNKAGLDFEEMICQNIAYILSKPKLVLKNNYLREGIIIYWAK